MALFEVKGRKIQTTYMGVNLGKDLHDHIRLAALYEQETMTRIVRKLLRKYLKKKPTFNELFPLLSKVILKEWDKHCIENSKKKGWKTGSQLTRRFDSFLDKIRKKLRRRRLPDYIIDRLIQTIEQQEIDRLEDEDII